MNLSRPNLAWLLLPALLACEPGDAPRPEPQPVSSGRTGLDYFPMLEGARWDYRIRFGALRSSEVSVEALGLKQVPGIEEPLFVVAERSPGAVALGFDELAPVGYVVGSDYIGRYIGVAFEGDGLRLLGEEDPTWILPLELAPDRAWSQQTRLMDLPEGDSRPQRWDGSIEYPVTVEVPAGEFNDCVMVRSEYWDEEVTADGPVLVYEDYYAPGVGLVRSRTTREGSRRAPIEQELLRFEFPEQARSLLWQDAERARASAHPRRSPARLEGRFEGGFESRFEHRFESRFESQAGRSFASRAVNRDFRVWFSSQRRSHAVAEAGGDSNSRAQSARAMKHG